MSCGLPHVELDAAIASVKKVLELAIENEQFPERELDRPGILINLLVIKENRS